MTEDPALWQKSRDPTGLQFGFLTVLTLSPRKASNGQALYECRCRCGRLHTTRGQSLVAGKTRSCGCLRSRLSRERLLNRVASERQPDRSPGK